MSESQVFATCNIGDEALGRIQEKGFRCEIYPDWLPPSPKVLLEKVESGFPVLITTIRDQIDRNLLEAGESTLRLIAQDAVGVDNIDCATASRLGIAITNTPDVLTDTTAEFALFMMGCVARKLYSSERLVRTQNWMTWHPSLPFLGNEVSGSTISVIGTGRIGRSFLLKSSGLDVNLLCVNPSGVDERFTASLQRVLNAYFETGLIKTRRRIQAVSLEEALEEGDFVSLHVPLTDATRSLIDKHALRRMKTSAFLVNASRGPVVDESALYQALKQGWIAGAALDVFCQEPLPEDSPLRDPEIEERLRLFHHFGSGGVRTRLSADPEFGMAGLCVESVIQFLEGKPMAEIGNLVNREAFQ